MTPDVVTTCYGLAALAFACLSLLFVSGWRGARAGAGLLIATVLTAVWGAVHAYNAGIGDLPTVLTAASEAARSLAWIVFLARIRIAGGDRAQVRIGSRGSLILSTTLAVMAVLASAKWLPQGFDYASLLLLAITGLHLTEQLYRNTEGEQQWAVKFLSIALMVWFGFDFVMYAEALLFSDLDKNWWAARAAIVGLTAPLVAVSAARNRAWHIDISVSRAVVFHTTTLFGTGVYLLIAAAAGLYVRRYGGTWGTVAQTVVFVAATVILAMILLSAEWRAKTRVLIAKHFFSYRFDYRNEWLRFTDQLSTAGHRGDETVELPVRIVKAICALVDSPGGTLWLRDGDQFVRHGAGESPGDEAILPSQHPLLAFMESSQWIVDLLEIRAHPERYNNAQLPYWLSSSLRAWAILPLVNGTSMIGFVIIERPLSKLTIDWEVRDVLKVAGRQAAAALGQMMALEQLLQARQFDAFNRMSAFVVHDLKNLVAQLALMLSNAEKHKHNPEFQADMLETVQNVTERMRGLLMQLRAGTRPIEQPRPTVLRPLVQQVLDSKRALRPRPGWAQTDPTMPASADDSMDLTVAAHQDRLERVIGHLVQNACEATPPAGFVCVRLKKSDQHALIEVEDNGPGMTEEFIRSRLFKPFESTKSHGMGIGVFESREYIQELGGRLSVVSTPGQGTRFTIELPRVDGPKHHPTALQE